MTDKPMQCPMCHRRWVNDYPGGQYCSHCKNPNGTPVTGTEIIIVVVEVTNEETKRAIEGLQNFKIQRIRENVARMARRRRNEKRILP